MFEIRALKELKIQARRLSKGQTPTTKSETGQTEKPSHTAALQEVARYHGFRDWQHARQVLSGQSQRGNDQGKLWHSHAVMGFLNHWFADYDEARAALQLSESRYLLPYQCQYLVVEGAYLHALGFEDLSLWQCCQRDLVAAYGSEAWDQIYAVYLRSQSLKNKLIQSR